MHVKEIMALILTFALLSLSITQVTYATSIQLQRSSSDGNDFWVTKNVASTSSRIHCAATFLRQLQSEDEYNSRSIAMKFNPESKTCIFGTLGPMSGDFVTTREENENDIHIPMNCLASSEMLGPRLIFYLSFLDDNPKGIGIYRHQGAIHRVKGWYTYPENLEWPLEKIKYLNVIPFKRPISGKIPRSRFQSEEMTTFTHPYSNVWTRMTLFHWVLFEPNDLEIKHHKIAYFCEVGSTCFLAFEINMGKFSFGVTETEIDVYHYHFDSQLYFADYRHTTTEQWLYIGLAYNLINGSFRIFENGVKKSEGQFPGVGRKWIKHIKTRPRLASGTLEIYDYAWSDQEIADHYQKALKFLGENCTSSRKEEL